MIRAALVLWSALLLLQPFWYLYWAPPGVLPPVWAAAAMSLPLLGVLPGLLRGRTSALAWGSYVGLAYFVHGVVVVMTNPAARLTGAVEVGLTLGFFTATAVALRRRPRK